jgi:hypothetical protein
MLDQGLLAAFALDPRIRRVAATRPGERLR